MAIAVPATCDVICETFEGQAALPHDFSDGHPETVDDGGSDSDENTDDTLRNALQVLSADSPAPDEQRVGQGCCCMRAWCSVLCILF